MNSCVYAGSFDPFHLGHRRIVERASKIFGRVFIVVADNPSKKYTLSKDERVAIARLTCRDILNVTVTELPHNTLISDYACSLGSKVIVKGIRNLQDTEYEKMLHEITVSQESGIDTVVLFSDPKEHKISSSAVKELMKYNADVRGYIPLQTKQLLELRQNKQIILGLTGPIGSGKSHVATMFGVSGLPCDLYDKFHPTPVHFESTFHHIDMDKIVGRLTYGKEYLGNEEVMQLRTDFQDMLGIPLHVKGMPNTSGICNVLFTNPELNRRVQELYRSSLVRAFRSAMAGKEGLILIDAALLIDLDLTYLCNNRVIMIKTPMETIKERLMERYNGNQDEVARRLKAQMSYEEKYKKMTEIIARDGYGEIVELDNSPRGPFMLGGSAESIEYLKDKVYPLVSHCLGQKV